MKRAIVIVTDSMGIGEMPDAHAYGDEGANTLLHIYDRMENFNIPNLRKLGIGNIEEAFRDELKEESPVGCYGKMKELSRGKDTITGHWEIAGIETKTPFKTYPDGFPEEFIKQFEKKIGRECIGNYPASGTEIIEDLGPEHEKTGKPIVYTSADSVFQIAANTAVIPLERLYEICEAARELLQGEWACGRVIARPYVIENGKRKRTSDRRDYAVSPAEETILDKVKKTGQTVYAIGKIRDIFNGQGITESVHTSGNMNGVDETVNALKKDFGGMIFTNLVDFDSLYGHRRNPEGYGRAIEEFDSRLPEIIEAMKDEDILFICADHGNDPVHTGFDHTREYVPLLVYGKKLKNNIKLGTRETFADLGATVADYLGAEKPAIGTSFLEEMI